MVGQTHQGNLERQLRKVICHELKTVDELIHSCIVQSFMETDSELNSSKHIDTDESGSTGVIVLSLGRRIYCANVGDSSAGLITGEDKEPKLKRLNREHTPSLADEKQRILNCGGRVEPAKGTIV
jgi:serine/threonine protein phosphatase PrpC